MSNVVLPKDWNWTMLYRKKKYQIEFGLGQNQKEKLKLKNVKSFVMNVIKKKQGYGKCREEPMEEHGMDTDVGAKFVSRRNRNIMHKEITKCWRSSVGRAAHL